jgi:hypothetical protein
MDLVKRDPALKTKWKGENTQQQLKALLTKTKKEDKDENIPKRAKSPYLYFCQDNRDKVRDELGETTKATDITKELGARWQKLNKDTKASSKKQLKKFEKLAEEDAVRYKTEKEQYMQTINSSKRPKRSKSAYLYFCEDNRATIIKSMPENSKVTEITKKLGEQWRLAVKEGKVEKYQELAKKDKERYLEEKKSTTSDSKLSGYKKFEEIESVKPENKSLSEGELKKKLTSEWKNLSAEVKATF